MPTIFPGADLSTFSDDTGQLDLDLSFTPIYGAEVVAQNVARLLLSPPGSYDDPSAGIDLRSYLNATVTDAGISALAAAIQAQAESVEGVDAAEVTTFGTSGGVLLSIITLALTSGDTWRMAFQLSPDNEDRVWINGVDAALVENNVA